MIGRLGVVILIRRGAGAVAGGEVARKHHLRETRGTTSPRRYSTTSTSSVRKCTTHGRFKHLKGSS